MLSALALAAYVCCGKQLPVDLGRWKTHSACAAAATTRQLTAGISLAHHELWFRMISSLHIFLATSESLCVVARTHLRTIAQIRAQRILHVYRGVTCRGP